MTTRTRGDMRYVFPLAAPMLAAGFNLLFRNIAVWSWPNWETVLVEVPVVVIYTCFTIDVWGITMSTTGPPEARGAATQCWLLLMLVHLIVYGVGISVERRVSQLPDVPGTWLAVNSILMGLALLLVWIGREKSWTTVEVSTARES